jgi:hypothetical protein
MHLVKKKKKQIKATTKTKDFLLSAFLNPEMNGCRGGGLVCFPT